MRIEPSHPFVALIALGGRAQRKGRFVRPFS
jgi:hypothetical protein